MGRDPQLGAAATLREKSRPSAASWSFSLPLLVAAFVYLHALRNAKDLLLDGDTYWHIKAGEWIVRNGAIPTLDPFSHTKNGAIWTAHEWLSEVMLALAHQAGGWVLVVVITACAFAATIALLTRVLLRWMEPIHVLLFVGAAVAMTMGHLLARPHILAMPLMMIWTIELVLASDQGRSPKLWLLPIMTLWANLHGGFTLGIALTIAFGLEVLLNSPKERIVAQGKAWGIFLALTLTCSLITPHGTQGILFTWKVLFAEHSLALELVSEWRSPNFQVFQPLELWLLGVLALALHKGLRLPPVRLLLIVGLLHLALKHARNAELVGLLAPLFVASAFAAQWRESQKGKQQSEGLDRFFGKLSQPASQGALLATCLTLSSITLWLAQARPLQPPEHIAPSLAIRAAQEAGVKGPVLNSYDYGGYLIYMGIPPFIDGRNDVYGDDFLKEYLQGMHLESAESLPKLLDKYKIGWTLLNAGTPAAASLDQLPHWRRIYSGDRTVVHMRREFGSQTEKPDSSK